MIRFSIIVPVYNTEKYLKKCLDSLVNQTFNNYEIIIVNDGSTDDSERLIKDYLKKYKNIKYFYKENGGGPSDARNYGIKKAKGEYFIFVDSDDYVDLNMLEVINNNLKNEDIIGFGLKCVDEKFNMLNEVIPLIMTNVSGFVAIEKFINTKLLFDSPTMYACKLEYYLKNKFKYAVKRYHEDFGLIPLIILKADSVSTINKSFYYYVQSVNSVTRNNDYEKMKKRVNDYLFHFDFLYHECSKIDNIPKNTGNIFNSFLSNVLISHINDLHGIDRRAYLKELKKRKVFDYLLDDSMARKMKKMLIKIMPSMYFKIFK